MGTQMVLGNYMLIFQTGNVCHKPLLVGYLHFLVLSFWHFHGPPVCCCLFELFLHCPGLFVVVRRGLDRVHVPTVLCRTRIRHRRRPYPVSLRLRVQFRLVLVVRAEHWLYDWRQRP